jgi:hypothetical protein
MGIFKRRAEAVKPPAPQIRSESRHPFTALGGYVPMQSGETALYRAIREAVPIVVAAIYKIIRLTGGVQVRCENEAVGAALNVFLRTVNTGRGQRGIGSFLDCYLDSLLTCGRAVGEIVPDGRRGDIAAVLCGNVADVAIREGRSPLDFAICAVDGLTPKPLPYQDLLLFTPFHPEPESPYGVSLLRSMPFLTDILMKIFQSVGTNWERAGNVRFAGLYKPQGDALDRAYARERGAELASEWSAAMQAGKAGSVRDFVAVGDVDIKVIGADNQILDSSVPVRQIMEQLIARTGIPPFLLGLSWSTTARMASQQADIMTSELTAIRRDIAPVIERICDFWLRLHGRTEAFELVWEEINLQDEVEAAKAALYRAQAAGIAAGTAK